MVVKDATRTLTTTVRAGCVMHLEAYTIGYERMVRLMPAGTLIRDARQAAGLTTTELARRAGTSRTAISAYEHGHKSPTVDTVERILHAAGRTLTTEEPVRFEHRLTTRNRPLVVPDRLPRLPMSQALRTTTIPRHLIWSAPNRVYRLADRSDRLRVYRAVLVEGNADDILSLIDGALLVDLWDELILPPETRTAWQPLIDEATGQGAR